MMEVNNGPTVRYKLVYCWRKKPIHALGTDGLYHQIGRSRGILVESESMGMVMYHYPEKMLAWRCKL